MLIRDISLQEVKAGRVWRVVDDRRLEMIDWVIEPVSSARDDETVVYSALAVLRSGEVRPLLLIREVGTYEWWGDTLEYVHGTWRELAPRDKEEWNAVEE